MVCASRKVTSPWAAKSALPTAGCGTNTACTRRSGVTFTTGPCTILPSPFRSRPFPTPGSTRKSCLPLPTRPRPTRTIPPSFRASPAHRIAWVAHGFEIVQAIYPGWKFTPADSVVANGLHGALLIGPRHEIGTRADEWLRALTSFEIELFCDGRPMDRGHALNVLEGPLSTIRYIMELLARDPDNSPLAAGEMISTGTLTRALPVKAGESWTTTLKGIALQGASIRFC